MAIRGRPKLYYTDEERRAALRAAWRKYNKAHRSERCAHNKIYSKRDDVKQRRRELYLINKNAALKQSDQI